MSLSLLMHQYFIRTPWIVKKIFSSYIWSLPRNDNAVYLTFDDGPHPVATPFVLDELKKFEASATFFCIGKNVVNHPELYQRIVSEGHAVGNHTHNHLNGWKTADAVYINNVAKAAEHIQTCLFRPPYGRIKKSQAKQIAKATSCNNAVIVMWDVLSADFDTTLSSQECLDHVVRHVTAGSIVVFHDSEKAFPHLKSILPPILEKLKSRGYSLKRIEV